jgi:glutamate racemase
VLHALKQALPNENFIYLGDTARLPYGTKSPETVQQYAINAAGSLVEQGVKLIVVACNTACSVAIEPLKIHLAPVPVIGVIEPAVKTCIELLGNPCDIGVIGTESTIKWHAYRKAFDAEKKGFRVLEWPCSLMVALAEQGWVKGALTQEILHKLLLPFLQENQELPALILGCTHFPVFKETLAQILHPNTLIIDSAQWVAKSVLETLRKHNALNTEAKRSIRYLVTDNPERFKRLSSIFLQEDLTHTEIEWVHLQTSTIQSLGKIDL